MLTPVRASSNASLSSHGQTAVIVASGLGRSVVAPTPAQAVEATDLNSAIAGKLNILLAAARERMFDALLDAINAASRALPLPRREEESNLAFASRLAEAIQKLPAARINEIETQLADEGHTLPLRLVAEALKNPAGPEAARVIAYLETIRYKDRDLAARAVVRSYRQNDASPLRPEARPNILMQEEKPLPEAQQSPVREAQASLPIKNALPLAPAVLIAEVAEQPVEIVEAFEEPVRVEDNFLEFRDAVDVPVEDQASADTPKLIEEPIDVEAHMPAVRTDHSEPVIPKVWTGVLASMTEEASELIVAIIGEQETATLLEDMTAAPETIEAIAAETAAGEDLVQADIPEAAIPAKLHQTEVTARLPVADATQIIRQQKDIVAQPQVLPADIVIVEAAQKSGLLKPIDGIPYAQHPYQFANDGADRRDGEMHRRDYEGSGSEGEQQANTGSEHQDAEGEGERRAEGVAPEDLPEVDATASGDIVADPVYALYQRMAGWE